MLIQEDQRGEQEGHACSAVDERTCEIEDTDHIPGANRAVLSCASSQSILSHNLRGVLRLERSEQEERYRQVTPSLLPSSSAFL